MSGRNGIMRSFSFQQEIRQLEKRKGGYYYLTLSQETVNQFPNKRHTRLLCSLDHRLTFACGLNHLGDGNFFIIVSSKNLATLDKQLGDTLTFELNEDPNPLGVEMPPVLEALLEQDPAVKDSFERLTLGKRRNVIHTINKIKDIDKQIHRAIQLIEASHLPRQKKTL